MTSPDWNGDWSGADWLLVFALGGYLVLREALHRFMRPSPHAGSGHAPNERF
jgi:hypothetical protein